MASASSSSVQRARPSGGFAQAVATSKASSSPVSLRCTPGTRVLTQRPFKIAFHEAPLGPVHGGTTYPHGAGNLFIAAAGIGRQQYLSPLELAGGPFAFAQHRGEFTAFGLAQFDPITYIHLGLLVGEPDESTNESKIRRRSQPRRARLHRNPRPVSGLHLRLFPHVPTLSGRSRYAAPLPRQPAFGSSDGADPRTSRPNPAPARRRPQHRTPRCSGRFAHPKLIENQPVKTSVPRY